MRKSSVALTSVAVVLIAAAAVARFVILPDVKQVPSNYDTANHYTGTVSMLNPTAIATGDTSKAFLTNVPVTANRRTNATSTSGSTIVLSDNTTVVGPTGTTMLTNNHTFAVNRKTLLATKAPSGAKVDAASGLPLGFPIGVSKKSYPYWDTTTLTTSPATYTGTAKSGGRSVYVYTVHNTGPVKDPTTLASLPTALPKNLLVALAAGLAASLQAQLAQFLPVLPDIIPLSYTATTDTKLWVDVTTGVVIDSTQEEKVTANMALTSGAVPLTAVLDLTLKNTPASITSNAKDASNDAKGLNLVGTTGPIVLVILAIILLILALILGLRKKNTPTTPAATTPPAAAPPADEPVTPGIKLC